MKLYNMKLYRVDYSEYICIGLNDAIKIKFYNTGDDEIIMSVDDKVLAKSQISDGNYYDQNETTKAIADLQSVIDAMAEISKNPEEVEKEYDNIKNYGANVNI